MPEEVSSSMGDCAFCDSAVPRGDKHYQEVSSWVNGPKLDGPKLRTRTGRVAHADCVSLQLAGQAIDQETMNI